MGILDRIKNEEGELIVKQEKVDLSIQDKLYAKVLGSIANRILDKILPMLDEKFIGRYKDIMTEALDGSEKILGLPEKMERIEKKLDKLIEELKNGK